ncbi:MAG: succinyl-CoA synthetase subunit alpha [Nanoarchaeota archaeon]|nr:succinyl-CoA synthetase subunit alpha [Nanoarchaeota archaeon]MBU1621954.1 succinyl-CoA synthetase subunit alpha [Nanoarchaeota archaeon]MBU1974186.1 succinyl-CoA synthetase subunit alpha [Nanoarchaeota archaeon]
MNNSYLNYEWFLKEDLSRYADKWLAIIDRKVVASGNTVNKVIKQVKKEYPNKRPFITKVRNKLSIL